MSHSREWQTLLLRSINSPAQPKEEKKRKSLDIHLCLCLKSVQNDEERQLPPVFSHKPKIERLNLLWRCVRILLLTLVVSQVLVSSIIYAIDTGKRLSLCLPVCVSIYIYIYTPCC